VGGGSPCVLVYFAGVCCACVVVGGWVRVCVGVWGSKRMSRIIVGALFRVWDACMLHAFEMLAARPA
jgi:hypothetical protein